jgi:hypothetical protein
MAIERNNRTDLNAIGSWPAAAACEPPRETSRNAGVTILSYLSAVLTETNNVLKLVPTPLTAVTIAILIPAAIRQYSMAVAPASSARNLEKNRRIGNSFDASRRIYWQPQTAKL